MEEKTQGPYGGRVDDAISQDLFPTGEPVGPGFGHPGAVGGVDQLRTTQASLEIIERHLEPLSTKQLAALMLLKQEGGQFAEMADFYMDNYHRRGAAAQLIEALSGLALVRNFRGVSVMKGTVGGGVQAGPGPGGFRR